MTAPTTPERQFATLLATAASRPFVTYYDEATGERSELSVRSLANWVAKTHHLLGTELGLGVGDRAVLAVPAHWISIPVLLGCLSAGLTVREDGPADVAFVSPETLERGKGTADVYAIAPDTAATGFGGHEPPATIDYVSAVRPHQDAWATVHPPAGVDDPCLPGLTRGAVAARAASSDLPPGARILTTRAWTSAEDWIDTVLAPVAVGGSVVIVAHCNDDAVLERRANQERVTVRR